VTKSQHSSHHQEKKEEASKNVLSLPPELLVKIFSHIPTYDLMQKVALVSKYFNQLTKLPGAHIDITLPEYVNVHKAAKFLENKTLIRQLKIDSKTPQRSPQEDNDSDDVSDDESVDEDDEFSLNSDAIVLSVCNHPHLRALELHGIRSNISFKSSLQLMESKCWKNLTILNIFIDFHSPGYERVEEINDFYHKAMLEMGSNVGIKKLSLGGAIQSFNDFSVNEVIDNHFEKVIEIHRNTLEELSIFGKCQPFELCHKLKTLEIHSQFVKFEKLPLLKNLTTLQIQNVGWHYTHYLNYNTLPANSLPNLKSLVIDITNLFNGATRLLKNLANACPNLEKLKFNILSHDFSNELILTIIKTCSKLEEFSCIHVDTYDKTEQEIRSISQFPRYLPNLKYLHLDGWNLKDADVKRIFVKRSSIEILQVDGNCYFKGNPILKERKGFFYEMKLKEEFDIIRLINVSVT